MVGVRTGPSMSLAVTLRMGTMDRKEQLLSGIPPLNQTQLL